MTLINNQYKIIKTIGKGGMGIVYLVEDIQKGNMRFALKAIRRNVAKKLQKRRIENIKNEYEIMTSLKHPNLTQVYDFGIEGESYYILMEYIEGSLLSDFHEKRMVIERTVDIMVQILRALQYIHSRNIVYGDIKPSNIMISGNIAKLMDFGLSGFKKDMKRMIRGTLAYMSPDALKGELSYHMDLFSLGIVFFEQVCSVPFYDDDNNSLQKIIKLLENPSEFQCYRENRLGLIENNVLRTIIKRLTSCDIKERYVSCSHVIDDINKFTGRRQKYEYETDETKDSYVMGNLFVNRKKELETLKSNIEKKKIADLIIFKGPSGIGKTRLFAEFKKFCRLNNIAFCDTSCIESGAKTYYAIADIIRQILIFCPGSIISKYSGYLKLIIPDENKLQSATCLETANNSNELKEMVLVNIPDFLISFSEAFKRKLVIFFDDIHWLDEGSALILKELLIRLKRKEDNKLYIYAGLDEDNIKGEKYLDHLFSGPKTKVVDLGPLDNTSISEYVENIFGPSFTDKSIKDYIGEFSHRSGGNPLYMKEFIKMLIREKYIIRDVVYWKLIKQIEGPDFPDDIVELTRPRILKILLNDKTKSVLQALSILRIDISPDIIECLFLSKWPDMGEVLVELENNDILTASKTEIGLKYSFVSKKVKEIIKSSINDQSEISLFIAKKLESMKKGTAYFMEEVAYHYLIANDIKKAEFYYEKCGDIEKKEGFNQKALEYYEQRLSLLKDKEKFMDDFLSVSLKKAECLEILGKWEDAVIFLEKCRGYAINHKKDVYIIKYGNLLGKIYIESGKPNLAKDLLIISYKIAKNSEDKLLHADCINKLLHLYFNISCYKEARRLFEKYKDFLKGIFDKRYYLEALKIIGNIFLVRTDYKNALECYLECLPIAEIIGDKRSLAGIINNIGSLHIYKGEYDIALEKFKTMLEISSKIGHRTGIVSAGVNLAIVFRNTKDYEKALKYAEQSHDLSRDIGYKVGLGTSAGTMGNIYMDLNLLDKALKCYEIYKNVSNEIGDRRAEGIATGNIGNIHAELGEFDKALYCYEQKKKTACEIGDSRANAIAIGSIGKAYFNMKKYDKARGLIENAINELRLAGVKNHALFYLYHTMSKISLIKKEIKEAFRYNDQAIIIANSLNYSKGAFYTKIQYYMTKAMLDKRGAVKGLLLMLEGDLDKEEEAYVYYAIGVTTGSVLYCQKALNIYQELYKAVPKHIFRERTKEMKKACRV